MSCLYFSLCERGEASRRGPPHLTGTSASLQVGERGAERNVNFSFVVSKDFAICFFFKYQIEVIVICVLCSVSSQSNRLCCCQPGAAELLLEPVCEPGCPGSHTGEVRPFK